MAPSTNANRGKKLADEVSNTASNMGEPAQEDMLLVMQNMMKKIEQHRKEMTIQKSATSERQSEHSLSARQSSHFSVRRSLLIPARQMSSHLLMRHLVGKRE